MCLGKNNTHSGQEGQHTQNDPALEPVNKIDTALKQAAVCGETLPSIKEFPEEEPAPAASASQHHSVHTLWSTP